MGGPVIYEYRAKVYRHSSKNSLGIFIAVAIALYLHVSLWENVHFAHAWVTGEHTLHATRKVAN